MLRHRYILWLSLIILLISASAQATTWTVEKDGSGDFTVIQHAVDAASSGDTIMIGPGRFDDFEPFDSGFWIYDIVVVILHKNNLTLIGSGVEETIIGSSEYYDPFGQEPQVIMGGYANNIRIENLKVENCENGIVWNSGAIEIENCLIENCYRGIYSFSPDGTIIKNSEFRQHGGNSVLTNGVCENVIISDCFFSGIGGGITFNSTPDALVNSCRFEGKYNAIAYQAHSTGQVTTCTMTDVRGSIYVSSGSEVFLLDNYLHAEWYSIYIRGGSFVSGTGNIISGGNAEFDTIHFTGGSTADLSGNHILKGEGYAVSLVAYMYEHKEINLANNYWGTTDIDSINEWIYDGNDDSSIHGTVIFQPLADDPVSTDKATLDGVKAMYR